MTVKLVNWACYAPELIFKKMLKKKNIKNVTIFSSAMTLVQEDKF